MSKRCFKCGNIKSLNLFYAHIRMADGHLNKCIDCARKDVAIRYYNKDKHAKILEYDRKRNKLPHRVAARYEYQKAYRLKYKAKEKARAAVQRAIRFGKIKRKPCEVCGSAISEAHHTDYSKPLEVKWLCVVHHKFEHRKHSVFPELKSKA